MAAAPFAVGKEAGLRGFEQVKAIHLHPALFSVENGLFTPTFKLKRPQARARFQVRASPPFSCLVTYFPLEV